MSVARRAAIRMTADELVRYVADRTVVTVATMGPHGRPHLSALWYVPQDTDPAATPPVPPLRLASWTYARSQKAVNLGRDPRATLLIESGDSYDQLRGVSLECDIELVTDTEAVADIGLALAHRYTPGAEVELLRSVVAEQAPKRVGLICTPTRIASWDHTKLGGTY